MSRLFSLVGALLPSAFAFAQPITIAAVGDIMLGSAFPFASELPPRDGRQMLSKIQDQWESADIVFGNLEGVLIDDLSTIRDCPPTSTTCFRFGMPARYAATLKRAGFTVLNVGNNHIQDFGDVGRLTSLVTLAKQKLTAFGTLEQPTATQILPSGVRVGWVGYAPHMGSNPPSVERVREQVRALKRVHDIVIVSMHIGAEGAQAQHVTRETELFLGQNRGNPYLLAHTAIDAGADLFLGHGPHVLRAMELYKGRLIAYSLGNFSTYGRFNLKGPNGIAGVLKVTMNENGELMRARFISTRQDRDSEDWRQGVSPVPDPAHEGARKVSTLSLSDFPESPLYIDSSGYMSWSKQTAETPPRKTLSAARKPAAVAAKPVKTTMSSTNEINAGNPGFIRSLYTRSRNVIRSLARN